MNGMKTRIFVLAHNLKEDEERMVLRAFKRNLLRQKDRFYTQGGSYHEHACSQHTSWHFDYPFICGLCSFVRFKYNLLGDCRCA